jgi:hypothetical protein
MKDSDDGQVERRVDPEQRSDRADGEGRSVPRSLLESSLR